MSETNETTAPVDVLAVLEQISLGQIHEMAPADFSFNEAGAWGLGYNHCANLVRKEVKSLIAERDALRANTRVKDPTGFSAAMVLDEAMNWTQRSTGKQMLLNYASMLALINAQKGAK